MEKSKVTEARARDSIPETKRIIFFLAAVNVTQYN